MESRKGMKICDEIVEEQRLLSITDPNTLCIMVDPVKLKPCGHSLGWDSAVMTLNNTKKCPYEDCGKEIEDFEKDLVKAKEINDYNQS